MKLDFLYRKVECIYCENKVKYKDAIVLKVIVRGHEPEKHWICSKCAEMIYRIQEANRVAGEREYLSQFVKPKWAIKQIIRYDRDNLVEDICEHGIGHPNVPWIVMYGKDGDGVHGCDGCCFDKKDKIKIKPDPNLKDIVIKAKKPVKKTPKKTIKKEKKTKIYSAEPLKIIKL